MSKIMKDFEKYTPEDIKFFNELAEKYGLQQNIEYLIITKEKKKIYVPKWRVIPSEDGPSIKIEEYIKELLSKE